MKNIEIHNTVRKGSVDIWNAYMVRGAEFTENDIPISVTTCAVLPRKLIGFDEAKSVYNKTIRKDPDFFEDAFIHFFIDDQKFDGKRRSIWSDPKIVEEIARHFAGIISPDFSIYQDFPKPIKMNNIYRMRAFDYWLEQEGIPCIHNVRWGAEETWEYCFDGIPKDSVIAIGTVASNLRNTNSKSLFENGFRKMIGVLSPSVIVIYGSCKSAAIDEARNCGIKIVSFPSRNALAFMRDSDHE